MLKIENFFRHWENQINASFHRRGTINYGEKENIYNYYIMKCHIYCSRGICKMLWEEKRESSHSGVVLEGIRKVFTEMTPEMIIKEGMM